MHQFWQRSCSRPSRMTSGARMYVFETEVSSPREAERLTTAFYRFLETKRVPCNASPAVTTQMRANKEVRRVALWSEEAVGSFSDFYHSFRVTPPAGLPRRIGRFDDLF